MKNYLWLCAIFICAGSPGELFAQSLPIKATRTIAFTTTEGSYMNVDVSPDGKQLVFDLLGDLYTVPVSGGDAKQLTRGVAINWRPVWSPDGKLLAYCSDRSGSKQLHIRNMSTGADWVPAGDEKESFTINPYNPESYCPVWTPDGKYILLGQSLYGITGGKLVAQIPDGVQPLGFFGKSDTLYVAGYAQNWSIPPAFLGALSIYNSKSKNIDTIYKSVSGFKGMALSPDRHWFAYAADSGGRRCLVLVDLLNHREHILVQRLAEYPLVHSPHFTFSPDSKFIYISYLGKIHRIDVQSGEERVLPVVIHVKSDLGPLNYSTFRVSTKPFKVKYTRSAVASPDGKQLAFTALNKVYVMDLPNGKPKILCNQPFNQFQPCWSPDGKEVAFVTWCDTAGGYLWRVPVTGGKPEQLTANAGAYRQPVFSPDGKKVAVIKGGPDDSYAKGTGIPKLISWGSGGIGQLQLIGLNNRVVSVVADSVIMNSPPTFTEDHQRIVFETRIPNNSTMPLPLLISTDLDGNNKKIVALGKLGMAQEWIVHLSESPDGRFFVYSRGEDVYLVPNQDLSVPAEIVNDQEQLQLIRFAKGMDPRWENGGQTLSWSYGNQFYRVNPDKIMDAAERRATKHDPDDQSDGFINAYVKPDQIIDLDVMAASAYGQGLIALKNVRVLTMKGNQVIRHGTLLIKNGRIEQIGNNNQVQIPRNAKIIDLSGKTIMPGFVDLHLHESCATDIYPQQNWEYLASLAYGVTTMRDPAINYDSFGFTELLRSGQMIGPSLYSTGFPVRTGEGIVYRNYDDALNTVEKRKLLGGTFMKNYLANGSWTRQQRQWLAMASSKEHLNMTNEGFKDVLLQLTQLKDGSSGVEHNPDANWGDVYKDVISFYARSKTFFTPTLQVAPGSLDYFNATYWHNPDKKLRHFLPIENLDDIINAKYDSNDYKDFLHAAQVDAAIRRAGGRVTFGSHGNNKGVGPHNELWALQMGGLSNMQALQAATIMSAQAIGIQKDVGSLEVGKIADLIILNSNPLDDIHNSRDIKYVMKSGILYNADNMDEIWPVYKKCPEWKLKTKIN